ncbi:MAG: phosphoribosylformylglycinamidine cyclo-ligase [Peptococcaceae bacterium]|jgi:phosphoribosylformylglycinamidine cyclo-ligase|nr:phosphoribosylformylglycinamidine cyclo-ligase [Peptococcaceae bacterium]MDH7526407.1 phosphoribosylformylglycinamidine cyclo-ligase [Peptococcaceae bacterium]
MRGRAGLTYREAGVDISQGNRTVEMIKPLAEKTFRQEVLGGLGGFGALFALDTEKYKNPVLVAGTDGVGTKLAVAQLMNRHDTIGIDCVAMCVNDILVSGAEPLFFLDYLAVGKLEPEQAAAVVAGIAEGCSQAGCALIGGETAEMPGFYRPGEYDVAGFAVGVVEREKIIDGRTIVPGDLLLGLSSNGLHSNGYSLARKIFFEVCGYNAGDYVEELGCSLGEELLKPTRIYAGIVRELQDHFCIKGMAHITGGGLLENPPRVLPSGLGLEIDYGSWEIPPVFRLLAREGPVEKREMLRTFNMGIGFVIIAEARETLKMKDWLAGRGEKASVIGRVVEGAAGVTVRGTD